MTDEIREQLSALLDDELAHHEMQALLDRLQDDDDLHDSLDTYQLISDVMRGEGVRLSPAGIAGAIREQIKSEPAIIAAPARGHGSKFGSRVHHWAKPAVGAALAASVAVMAVYLFPQIQGVAGGDGVPIVASSANAPYHERTATRWKNLPGPKVESQLNRYLVDHNEFSSSGAMSGVAPYASFVTYDSNSSR
ncbi:MAG: sigma-E factor negative regulatory protein [Candidatus Sedimenticola sp. (ex Thyasira tokunagai)]